MLFAFFLMLKHNHVIADHLINRGIAQIPSLDEFHIVGDVAILEDVFQCSSFFNHVLGALVLSSLTCKNRVDCITSCSNGDFKSDLGSETLSDSSHFVNN